MDGLVACLKGKGKEKIEAVLQSLGEDEAEQIRIKLEAVEAKSNKEELVMLDLTKDPSTDAQKSLNQTMKETSMSRSNKKLGESGTIKPLEWQAFNIKAVAMFCPLRKHFTMNVNGTNLCALERTCWEKLEDVTESQWENHFASFATFHRTIIDRCRSVFTSLLSDMTLVKFAMQECPERRR